MKEKFEKLLKESKESANLIARNNDIPVREVRKWRLGKATPEDEVLKKLIAYFEKGGNTYVKMQKDPLKELERQNRALKYFIKSKDYSLREVGI